MSALYSRRNLVSNQFFGSDFPPPFAPSSSYDQELHYISGFGLCLLLQHPDLRAFEATKYPTV